MSIILTVAFPSLFFRSSSFPASLSSSVSNNTTQCDSGRSPNHQQLKKRNSRKCDSQLRLAHLGTICESAGRSSSTASPWNVLGSATIRSISTLSPLPSRSSTNTTTVTNTNNTNTNNKGSKLLFLSSEERHHGSTTSQPYQPWVNNLNGREVPDMRYGCGIGERSGGKSQQQQQQLHYRRRISSGSTESSIFRVQLSPTRLNKMSSNHKYNNRKCWADSFLLPSGVSDTRTASENAHASVTDSNTKQENHHHPVFQLPLSQLDRSGLEVINEALESPSCPPRNDYKEHVIFAQDTFNPSLHQDPLFYAHANSINAFLAPYSSFTSSVKSPVDPSICDSNYWKRVFCCVL